MSSKDYKVLYKDSKIMSLTLWVVKLTPSKRIALCYTVSREQEEIPSFSSNFTLSYLISILFVINNISFSWYYISIKQSKPLSEIIFKSRGNC